MTISNRSIPAQDLQILANRLNAAYAEAVPRLRRFLNTTERTMRPWLEEAERRNQDKGRHAFLIVVEQAQRDYAATMVQENDALRNQLRRYQRPMLSSNQPDEGEFWMSLK